MKFVMTHFVDNVLVGESTAEILICMGGKKWNL
jgi:hypothetical protein